MLLEGAQQKEQVCKNITEEDILNEMSTSIEDKVTPYFKHSYPEQIEKKRTWLLESVLKEFCRNFENQIKQNKEFPTAWYRDIHLEFQKGVELPICPLDKIIECDLDYIEGYRNKVEFTVGREFVGIGKEGDLICGFNQGSLSKGIMYVGKPDNIAVISTESKQVAKSIQGIIQDFNKKYGIDSYNHKVNQGFWRIVLYRESKKTKEMMISLIVTELNKEKEDEITEEQLQEIQDAIRSEFALGKNIGRYTVKTVSMIFATEISGGYKEGDRYEVLQGDNIHYSEELLGFKFIVSPFAFF